MTPSSLALTLILTSAAAAAIAQGAPGDIERGRLYMSNGCHGTVGQRGTEAGA